MSGKTDYTQKKIIKKFSEWPADRCIVAIDFDGTITLADNRIWKDNNYSNDLMEPNYRVINWIHKNRDKMYLILWTCRTGKALEDAIKFSSLYKISYDTINENVVDFECSNKVMADYYIDDKSIMLNKLEDINI